MVRPRPEGFDVSLEALARFVRSQLVTMTKKYLVVTKVDGKITMLSLSSNSSHESDLENECGQMLAELFTGHRLDEYFVQPWPLAIRGAVDRQAVARA